MTKTDQEGKLMMLTVKSVYDGNPTIATLRPGIVPVMNRLTDQIKKIIKAQTLQATPTEGKTTDKAKKFKILAENLFIITSAGSAYASSPAINDPDLKAKLNHSLSFILNTNYDDIEALATIIINAVTPIIDDLDPFGATDADLTATTLALTKYLGAQSAPQEARDERQTQTQNIHPFVVEGKRILDEEADPIINTLFLSHNELYKNYYNARPIVHLPHGTTVADGFVYEADGVTGIYNAQVDFAPQGLSVKTLLDGSFTLPHFPHGVTTPTASAAGKQPQTLDPKEIKQGKTVHFIFKLNP